MKNIKIFAFLAVFLLFAAVSTAWATDVTLTYKISVRGFSAYITNADDETVCDWAHAITLWPANEGHSMNDGYGITFTPDLALDKTGKNENDKSTSTTAFRTKKNTTFKVSVGKKGFYLKSVTFKEDRTEKASSSNIAPNSTSIDVEVPENKFFNYITVVLTDDIHYSLSYDGNLTVSPSPSMTYNNIPYYAAGQTVTFGFSGSGSVEYFVNGVRIEGNSVTVRQNLDVQIGVPYIDENGKTQIREPGGYTVLTSSTNVSNLGGGWYVVQGKVKYSNQVKFIGDAHLILADGAEMEIETKGKSEHGIYVLNNLTIYGQNGQSGIVNDTAKGTGGYGIYSYSGDITINGGTVTATGDYDGICSYNGVTINGGSVTATGTNGRGIYSEGNITINGGTVEATGSNRGIYGYKGVTINGGTVTASGDDNGIYSYSGDITISGGSVTATGGSVTATSTNGIGIYSYSGDITIIGGTVEATGTGGYGIYSRNGSITISGGSVTATGGNYGIYSYSGDITISGGSVTATGGSVTATSTNGIGIYSEGNITISGDTVTATGSSYGIRCSNGVTISGGKVTATSTNGVGIYSNSGDITISGGSVTATGGSVTATSTNGIGIYSNSGDITLGWTNGTDFIYASSYSLGDNEKHVSIAEGKSLKDEDGNEYSGPLTGEQLSAIEGKTLEPTCYAVTFDAQNGDDPIMLLTTFDENGVAYVAKPADPTRDGFTFEGWFTTTDGNTEFDFSAAITGNTTAYAKWSVPYIDEKGAPKSVTDYTVLTSSTDVSNLSGGWYVVQGKVKYSNQVKFSGEAHLILADGAEMEIETKGETEHGIYASKNLTIYGQNEQRGILNDTAKGTNGYGIYSMGSVTIIGGKVTATGDNYGIYGYNGVTINGGTVEATGTNGYGIYGYKGVTISGGTVTATSTNGVGIYSNSGNITLGWTNDTDFIKASSYYSYKGSVQIAEGKSFKDEKGYVYRGTLNAGQLSSLKDQKIEPFKGVSVSFVDNFSGASEVIAEIAVDGESHVSAPSKHPFHSGYAFVGWFAAPEGGSEFDFTKAVSGNTTAYAHWNENTPVEYIDENGGTNETKNYILLTNDINVDNLPGGWYVVQGEVKYTSQVMFSGDAHLILADGAKLEIETKGESEHGIYASNNLTIYGQNEQSGILNDTAKGTNGSGIYSNFGDITIIGSSVTATGTSGPGICGYKGVTISGGSVTATGNDGILSYDGNITLGWTNSTDSIYASSYYSESGSVKIAEGRSFKDEDGKAYSGTLSSTQLGIIKKKTLKPCYAVALDLQDGKAPVMLPAAFDENGVAYVAKPADPTRDGFTFEGWFTTTDGNTEFDFSAAITGNTTAYAKWSVPYIDEKGAPKSVTDYTVLTSSTNVSNLPGGWYVVQGKVKYSNQVKFNGDAHLILADEAKLEIETEGQSEHGIYASNNLTIYGQNEQRGILNDTAKGTNGIGIYSKVSVTIIGGKVTATGLKRGIYCSKGVTISGGTVTATGTNVSGIYSYSGEITISGGSVSATGTNGRGIYGYKGVTISGGSVTATGTNDSGIYSSNGSITISGGTVEATGDDSGIYSYSGDITIIGGSVTATGSSYGIRCSNGVTISGGMVEATGDYGIYSRNGNITLDWTNSTDFINASSYYSGEDTVQIAKGKSLKDEKGYVYRGTLNAGQLSSLKGQKIEPFEGVSVSFVDNFSGASDVFAEIAVDGEDHVSAPSKHPFHSGYAFVGWFAAPEGGSEFDFTKAVTGNTTAYAHWNENTPVEYIDENGGTNETKNYILLTNDINVDNLPGGWYVVQGKVEYTSQVKFSGDAHLILADGAEMEIETESRYGIYASKNLTIYGQNGQSGILNDTAKGTNGYGIYSRGNITIIGGKVSATGDHDGICSYNGVTISGGSVTATSTNGYGIYSYNGVTIIGGTVTASGNNSGINAKAGHITLGWTNSTDSIKVSRIHLGADSCTVSIAEGKSLKDEDGIVYTGKLTDENLESIKNKTLTPLMPFPDNIFIDISDTTYTGDSIRPKPVVTIGENDTLELGKDYTLAYKDNLNASDTAKVIVKGAGKYCREVQKSFTIDKAPLKITALNDTITYGDEPTNQGVAYEGFVGNETSEVLKGELALKIDYKQYDDAGKYAITPSGLEADNYEIEFVAGTLTVKPKVISIVWGEQTVFAYDDMEHVPTVTAKDFVEGHEASLVVTGAAVNAGKHTAKVALDENDANSKNYKLPATGLEKEFKIAMPIAYIDENGVEQTVTDYTVLTSDVTDYIENGVINLPGGWYVVEGEVKYTSQVKFEDDAHLILADGATMEIETEGESEHGIYASKNLTIYGQNGQSGILNATAKGTIGRGIYSMGSVTIIGGTVTATGNEDGIYGYNGVTISGGTVTATGTNGFGILCFGVTISGGSVTATGKSGNGIYSVSGDITLGWTNSTDFIYASSYSLGDKEKHVSIAKGKSLKDEKGIEYRGTLTDENLEYIKNKTLVPLSFKGKFLSDVNIAVADIPVQKYADGKPVCPSVVVTDGKDTLTAGTDYMVVCSNNTAVSSATLDEAAVAQITGKGNYAGAIQKRFFIWNNIRDYAAVQVFEDEKGKKHAVIDGEYEGKDVVNIGTDISVNDVVFNREFTPNSGHATIMFPFDVKASSLTGVRSVIEFDGVKTDKNDNKMVGMRYVWCNATLGEQEELNKHPNCNKYSGELKAYTPYMIEMDSATLGIKDAVTLKSNSGKIVGDAPVGNWVFRGTLQKKEWPKGTGIINEGRLWAFSAAERSGAKIGEFVQFGGNNWANPFRAYLVECKKSGEDSWDCQDDSEPKASQVARYRFTDALAPTNSAEKLAGAVATDEPLVLRQAAASETALLNSMDIVIVYGDSASGERPTVIGRMNPATGEIRMLPRTKQTYDLKGRRVNSEKRNARGAYYGKHGRK